MTKVMIVDDSAFARSNLKRALTAAGYDIFEVASGEDAINLATRVKPDIVTLDLLMPGLSGLETLKTLKNQLPETRYVVITADVQNKTREELLQAGAHAFINKPFSETALIETFQNLV
ncbi:MAG: response regulator [Anaerolineae bacterium]|nr:response regulator [Anaerolineae bacterium]